MCGGGATARRPPQTNPSAAKRTIGTRENLAQPMSLQPTVEGACPIRSAAPEFRGRMKQRVAAGLLSGRPQRRSNYVVAQEQPGALHIRAADWPTALAVGLNELELDLSGPGVVRYRVRYWRWAAYCLGLCGSLGLVGLVLLLFTDVRSYIARHEMHMIPGLSVEQNLLVAWGMALFWGFAWPWLLIRLHRRPLQRLIERLISEVDAGGEALARASA